MESQDMLSRSHTRRMTFPRPLGVKDLARNKEQYPSDSSSEPLAAVYQLCDFGQVTVDPLCLHFLVHEVHTLRTPPRAVVRIQCGKTTDNLLGISHVPGTALSTSRELLIYSPNDPMKWPSF